MARPTPGTVSEPGLVVYRFGVGLFYANAERLSEEVAGARRRRPIRRAGSSFTRSPSTTSTTRAARRLSSSPSSSSHAGIVFAVAERAPRAPTRARFLRPDRQDRRRPVLRDPPGRPRRVPRERRRMSTGTTERTSDEQPAPRRRSTATKVEHFTLEERAARGKAARAEVPRRSTPSGNRRRTVPIPSSCSRSRRRPACPSSCRSATGACSSRRSRSTAARPL